MVEPGGFKKISVEAHQYLFDEGDSPDVAYMIREGSVEIRKGARTDNPRTLAVLGKGDVFGEVALFDDSPRMAAALTTERCSLVAISRKAFKQRLDAMDPIMMKIVVNMATRLRDHGSKTVVKHTADWSGWDKKG